VLGTRRTDRTLTTSASPVDVISSDELTAQPSANMMDALKNIIPSFYVGQNTISDASTFVRSPSLRGLSGDQVLVMLNGKRYNRSALVQVYGGSDTGLGRGAQGPDISAIPALAVGNVQVLRRRDRAIWLGRDRRRAQLRPARGSGLRGRWPHGPILCR
jgi:iron complex outermembrane receptor protein